MGGEALGLECLEFLKSRVSRLLEPVWSAGAAGWGILLTVDCSLFLEGSGSWGGVTHPSSSSRPLGQDAGCGQCGSVVFCAQVLLSLLWILAILVGQGDIAQWFCSSLP